MSRDFMPTFVQETNPTGPQIGMLKYFRMCPQSRGDIRMESLKIETVNNQPQVTKTPFQT